MKLRSTWSRASILVVAIAFLLWGAALPATATAALDSEITWGLQPADESGQGQRVSLRHTVDPGASFTDAVALTNYSDVPATFAVYASDGVVTAAGDFDLLPGDQEPTDGGTWVTIDQIDGSSARSGGGILIPMEPQSTVDVPLNVAVPGNATPGDHPVGIVAELVSDNPDAVRLTSRVGVRMHLQVNGEIVPRLEVTAITTSYRQSWNPFAPGQLAVTYTIANTGNVRLGAESTVEIAGPFGLDSNTVSSEVREILPGGETVTTVELQTWPLFHISGQVSLTPVVVGEDQLAADVQPVTASFGAPAVSWSWLILIALVIGLIVWIIVARKRGKAKTQRRIDAAVAAAIAGDTPHAATPTSAGSDHEDERG